MPGMNYFLLFEVHDAFQPWCVSERFLRYLIRLHFFPEVLLRPNFWSLLFCDHGLNVLDMR